MFRLIVVFLLAIPWCSLFASALFAASVYTDHDYFTVLKKDIDQASVSINITLGVLSMDSHATDPVRELIEALNRAAHRGVAVQLSLPPAYQSSPVLTEIPQPGILLGFNAPAHQTDSVKIDGRLYLGTQQWAASSIFAQARGVAIVLEPLESWSVLPAQQLERRLLALIEATQTNICLAFGDVSAYSPSFRRKLLKLLENKRINHRPVQVLLSQSSVTAYSIQDLYSRRGNTIDFARDLQSLLVPVDLTQAPAGFDFQLYLLDSTIILGVRRDRAQYRYFMLDSSVCVTQLRAYLSTIPHLSVTDILRYN